MRRQKLDCDWTIEFRIETFVNDSHSTAADHLFDAEVIDTAKHLRMGRRGKRSVVVCIREITSRGKRSGTFGVAVNMRKYARLKIGV